MTLQWDGQTPDRILDDALVIGKSEMQREAWFRPLTSFFQAAINVDTTESGFTSFWLHARNAASTNQL
jgi:hypothetical protein